MKVLVIYHSPHAHAREAAEAIASAVRNLNHNANVKAVMEVRKVDVDLAEVVFVGTEVEGFLIFGVKPAGASRWVPSLPTLRGKPVGVFCTYSLTPRDSLFTLGALLEQHGATIRGQHAFHRGSPTKGAAEFAQSVIGSAERPPL